MRPEDLSAPLSPSTGTSASDIPREGSEGQFFSPLVRSIAKEEGVSIQELESISGSGQGGRVTKKDILGYVAQRGSGVASQGASTA
ncbi:MAG: E3 binding domain-containing protein [Bacteroidota bacterium]